MRVKILKEDLVRGINVIQNVVDIKSALPILSNILMETTGDKLRLTATDLNIGVSCVLPVEIMETGAITIPAKKFGDIIKELSEQEINIVVKKNNQATIETKNCQFKLMGLPKEEFPKLPEFKDKEAIILEQQSLKKMLGMVSFAVSYDEARYVLNGILFKITKDALTLVATDGRRLALMNKKIPRSAGPDISIIIPIKTIQELMRSLGEEGDVSLVVSLNQVCFELNNVVIVSRLLEGEFPDYQAVVPGPAENKIKLDREQFLWAVRRAAILSTPDYQAVKMEVFKNRLVISKSTPDVGESREELPAEYAGKELVMGFNPAYLIDVLKNLEDDTVFLEITEADKPAVLRKDGYVYIVLPMRLG